ncbi:neuroparsin-A [Eurytemora carolleeae]|uniref:neuroparsin-A n=1 Tax=Eurytemora carolleeae TaxID=1294199 RepID=UPI000C77AA89|nr:neuroparsin-A [Eurytemora carolleeae]|eukprot:XP_023338517.1 neuroparsin-A-like [Eurytemora affinis]
MHKRLIFCFCIIICLSFHLTSSLHICSMRKSKDDSECVYGTETDLCGIRRCRKGPGEICGGWKDIYGACATGLTCSNCGSCSGCSYQSFICWDDIDCMAKS